MKNTKKKKKAKKGLAIVSLLLNIIIWPGLGTLIARKFNIGVLQMVLSLVGFALMYVMPAALIIIFVAWIWGLISGIKIVVEAYK